MNIERLEMMRVMMERVVAGSWKPEIDAAQISVEKYSKIAPDVIVSMCDLSTWASSINYQPNANGRNMVCGFSACAVGHACFDEEFRKLGWKWDGRTPTFDGREGLHAAMKFFGITMQQSKRLFLPESYDVGRGNYIHLPKNVREAKMVADRLQKLITTGKTV